MANRVKDKVTLVTGAGSVGPGWGNGKAAAVLYAREGARVFAVDLNLDAAEETQTIISGEGGKCIAFRADVSSADQVTSMVKECLRVYGRIDILHNNVGVPNIGGLAEVTEQEWDQLFAINVKSVYLTCRSCIPSMVRQGGGVIVNISSIASIRYVGFPCVSYATCKAAINQFTQNIAIQYADKGIRANCVLPGLIHTPHIEHFLASAYGGDVDRMIKKRHALVPMQRMGDAWDVAHASLFLVSNEAKYITGVQLLVDGGISCKIS